LTAAITLTIKMLVEEIRLTTIPHGPTEISKLPQEEILSGNKLIKTTIFLWAMHKLPINQEEPPPKSRSSLD
jgi:hypothetical protein